MKKLSLAAAVLLSATLFGCEQSKLHDSMEEMGSSIKSFHESDSPADMKADLAEFIKAIEVAKQQKVQPDEQESFEKGLNEAEGVVKQMQAALDAGNVAAAKALLPKLGSIKKEYHKKFGVH